MIIVLSCLSVITLLMINFVSGFLVVMVYLIISTIELLKKNQIKNIGILLVSSIIGFTLLSTVICIIPTKWMNRYDPLTSAYWVGVDTVGKRRVEFVRNENFKVAKLFGQADLENIPLKDEQGYWWTIQNAFSTNGDFAFLGLLSRYGWIVSFEFVLIMIIFNVKLIRVAIKINDVYGKLIIIGIASLYLVQTICNFAMNFGFGIIAEFTLPFVSDDYTSLLVNVLCIALVLSIYRRKNINFEEPKKSKVFTKVEDFFFEDIEEKTEKI